MALYRNIAGVNGSGAVGLTLLSPTMATLKPIDLSPTAAQDFRDLIDLKLSNSAEIQAQAWALKNERYDYLLSHSFEEVTAAGYFVTLDTGSIFKHTDTAPNTIFNTGSGDYAIAYLALMDIQDIENERGNAGTLLMHMREPAIAKNTAGYIGGGSFTFGSALYTEPIPEVRDLPPVHLGSDGIAAFEYSGPSTVVPTGNTNTTTTTTTTTATTPNTTTAIPAAAVKNNIAPLVALGGLVAVALAGDSLTGRRTNLLFAGGVGAFFYFMAKRSK